MTAGKTVWQRFFGGFGICSAVFKAPGKFEEAFGEVGKTWGSLCFGDLGYGVGKVRRERMWLDLEHGFTAMPLTQRC